MLLIYLFAPLCFLPWRWQRRIGKTLGLWVYVLAKKRRKVVRSNLRIAGLDLEPRDVFSAQGTGLMLTLSSWIRGAKWVARHARFEGLEYLTPRENGHGAVVVTPHFCNIEFAIGVVSNQTPLSCTYMPATNAAFEAFRFKARAQGMSQQIPTNRIRTILRALQNGSAITIAPDHATAGNLKGNIVRFFDRDIAIPPATIELARRAGHRPVMLTASWNSDTGHYDVRIRPLILDDEDIQVATQQLASAIEASVRANPLDYFWMHRLFKPVHAQQDDPYR